MREQALEHHRQNRLLQAERLYRTLLCRYPRADVASNLGALLRAQGRFPEAEAHYRWALQQFNDPQLLSNACNLFRDLGYAEQTLDYLNNGLAQWPADFGLRQGLALSLHHCHRYAEALQILAGLLEERPQQLSLLLEQGACLAKQGDRLEALQIFERAHALNPGDVQIQANRICLLSDLGRFDDAEQLLKQAAGHSEDPRLIAAQSVLMSAQNQVEAALELQLKLVALEPHVADHWLHVAASQLQLGQMVAPLRALQQALKQAPGRADLQLMLGRLLVEHGSSQAGLALLRAGADHPDASDTVHSIFQFAAAGHRLDTPSALKQRVEQWEQKRALTPAPIWADRLRDPDPDRPLRVGYLSPDYCNHPVARFMLPVFAGHDRCQITVIGLSCGKRIDFTHSRVQRSCDEWHDLRFADDETIARFLADLQLDLLIDLGGYTSEQRLRPLTAKPAPIQLSYLGYPASTFLSCMDGWIGDRVVFGPQQEQETGPHEELLQLDRCYLAYQPPVDAPDPDRTAPDQRFRFGCFNHSRKLSEACLDLFAAVLLAAPGSLLVLKSATFVEAEERQRIRSRLVQRGITADRLEMLEWVQGDTNHLSLYSRMDVALDTTPYGGTTTTCEALWMGVPVLTLAGASMVERQSAAVLAGAGLEAAIATTPEQFIQNAVKIARNGPRTRQDRLALRQYLSKSSLLDTADLVRHLEQLYRSLWQRRSLTQRL